MIISPLWIRLYAKKSEYDILSRRWLNFENIFFSVHILTPTKLVLDVLYDHQTPAHRHFFVLTLESRAEVICDLCT
jgi:hypothetical protein